MSRPCSTPPPRVSRPLAKAQNVSAQRVLLPLPSFPPFSSPLPPLSPLSFSPWTRHMQVNIFLRIRPFVTPTEKANGTVCLTANGSPPAHTHTGTTSPYTASTAGGTWSFFFNHNQFHQLLYPPSLLIHSNLATLNVAGGDGGAAGEDAAAAAAGEKVVVYDECFSPECTQAMVFDRVGDEVHSLPPTLQPPPSYLPPFFALLSSCCPVCGFEYGSGPRPLPPLQPLFSLVLLSLLLFFRCWVQCSPVTMRPF